MISKLFFLTALFSTKTVNEHPTAPPGSAIKRTVGTWEYQGCYNDFGPRILEFRFDIPEGNTAERCTQTCADRGFGIAGLENGNECWCDNYNHFGKLPIKPDEQCNFACPGNETEWCGAGNRLVLYENTAGTPSNPNFCIDWRSWDTFKNIRLQAIPKAPAGGQIPVPLCSIPRVVRRENYRIISTCTSSCPWTLDYHLEAYGAKALNPTIGGIQGMHKPTPNTFTGYRYYPFCAKPDPMSPWGGYTGFPLLSGNGDAESWALCPNTEANGRRDLVYSPIDGHAQYSKASCEDVYIQITPSITDWENHGVQSNYISNLCMGRRARWCNLVSNLLNLAGFN